MNTERTSKALAEINDEGLFERIATAILRESNPRYHSLAHPGVNVNGKTVKSPLDGICFIQGAVPPHMIAVHHTTTRIEDLEKKWLHDPSTVKPRKGSKPTAPAGDLLKTAEIAVIERQKTPDMRVTLVLTTNEEPGEDLVRAVEGAGRDNGLEIDIWSRSRLSHVLDNLPSGQWIRRTHLNLEQELLSTELLLELSKKSLIVSRPFDDPAVWVQRTLDEALETSLRGDVTFLVAGSGLGKSVSCYRKLTAYVETGGFGIILGHEDVAQSITLEQAVQSALRRLHPSLAATEVSALSLCSPERPLLIVVEDINRSGQPQGLTEKIVGWSRPSSPEKEKGVRSSWRLVCPIWPEILLSMQDQVLKLIQPLVLSASGFTESEGRSAVLARARFGGHNLSSLSSEEISRSLGNDPLLIALNDQWTTPDPHQVIGRFVENSLSRTSVSAGDLPPASYRQALRALAGGMLSNRRLELSFREISSWPELTGDPLRCVGRLAHQGELICLSGTSDDQRLLFRHDRVRDWLLADAAADLDSRDLLSIQIIEEPYFTEIMGAVLSSGKAKADFLTRVAITNPLVLFHALRFSEKANTPMTSAIAKAIDNWLEDPAAHNRSNYHLRWEALAVLAETESPQVLTIVRKLGDCTPNSYMARFRNGDVTGAIDLCVMLEPGVGAPERDAQIEHAKVRYGHNLIKALDGLLKKTDLDSVHRGGVLRLAGHIADPNLAVAIEACWAADGEREGHLADYLWAFGRCCGDSPERFLARVCDAWALLPSEDDQSGSLTRNSLAADQVRWAFQRWPPIAAIGYFVQRASHGDLKWPITYMLHSVDHPTAVLFLAQELAEMQRNAVKGSFPIFQGSVISDWHRAQETEGRPMSKPSRDALLGLWNDEKNDIQLRLSAFALWSATKRPDDLAMLQNVSFSGGLGEKILWQRLRRGDQLAIPTLIERLAADDNGYWWQCGRYLWAPELTEALDKYLDGRAIQMKGTFCEGVASDWITHEMIMRLPVDAAELLLLKHWAHLRFTPDFVQTALYFATPQLKEAVRVAVSECPEPAKLFEHLGQRFGLRSKGLGINRMDQVLALKPYLNILSPMDIRSLWDVSNERGWIDMRRVVLDSYLQPPFRDDMWDRTQVKMELDKMAEARFLSISHWIDRFVITGISWPEILDTMTSWLAERRSVEALSVVAAAVRSRGSREDLAVLEVFDGMPEDIAIGLIQNTTFAVRRRSIR